MRIPHLHGEDVSIFTKREMRANPKSKKQPTHCCANSNMKKPRITLSLVASSIAIFTAYAHEATTINIDGYTLNTSATGATGISSRYTIRNSTLNGLNAGTGSSFVTITSVPETSSSLLTIIGSTL